MVRNLFNMRSTLHLPINYQLKTLYNQINKHTIIFYSSKAVQQSELIFYPKQNFKLNHFWLTGFSDWEASFIISIVKDNKRKTGWLIQISFSITLHIKDKPILEEIKNLLGVGRIYSNVPKSIYYRVTSKDELAIIIQHFNEFPLITKKRAGFLLFQKAFVIIKNDEHLTDEGLRKIVAIKASLNRGLSSELKRVFPDVVPAERPIVETPKTIDPEWLARINQGRNVS